MCVCVEDTVPHCIDQSEDRQSRVKDEPGVETLRSHELTT